MSVALEVNGCRVNATSRGAEYWAWFEATMHRAGRITILKTTLGGDLVRVACDDKDHAEWLATTFEANGMHKSALKIVTVADQS